MRETRLNGRKLLLSNTGCSGGVNIVWDVVIKKINLYNLRMRQDLM